MTIIKFQWIEVVPHLCSYISERSLLDSFKRNLRFVIAHLYRMTRLHTTRRD